MAAKATQQVGRIAALQKLGQSLWLDNIRRQFITSGELARLRDEGVTGVTSNPTIFEKAISKGEAYDAEIRSLMAEGKSGDGNDDEQHRTDRCGSIKRDRRSPAERVIGNKGLYAVT